jgi:hypothetical protein
LVIFPYVWHARGSIQIYRQTIEHILVTYIRNES